MDCFDFLHKMCAQETDGLYDLSSLSVVTRYANSLETEDVMSKATVQYDLMFSGPSTVLGSMFLLM